MPKRMSRKERRVLLDALVLRHGDICTLCNEMPVVKKTIDHVNGKQRDDRIENLALLCGSCNTAEGNRARHGTRLLTPETLSCYHQRAHAALVKAIGHAALPAPSGPRVTLRVSERAHPGVDRRGWGTAEEAANQIMEPTYRLWLYRWVRKYGYISKDDAVDAGAEYLDQHVGRASQQTVERYFRKAISREGWLEERRGDSSEPVWGFRPDVDLSDVESMLMSRMKSLVRPVLVTKPAAEPAEAEA